MFLIRFSCTAVIRALAVFWLWCSVEKGFLFLWGVYRTTAHCIPVYSTLKNDRRCFSHLRFPPAANFKLDLTLFFSCHFHHLNEPSWFKQTVKIQTLNYKSMEVQTLCCIQYIVWLRFINCCYVWLILWKSHSDHLHMHFHPGRQAHSKRPFLYQNFYGQSAVQTRVVMILGFQTQYQYPRTHLRLQTLFNTTGIFIPVTNIVGGGGTFQQIKQKATVWTDCSRSSVLEAQQYRFILMRKLHKWLFYESFTDKYQRTLHTWSRKSKHKYKNEPTEICFMTFTQDFQLSLTTGSTFNKLPLLAFHSCALFYGLWRHHSSVALWLEYT